MKSTNIQAASAFELSVTSDGSTGEIWIEKLRAKGFHVGDYAKSLLTSNEFEPTNGTQHRVIILKGFQFEDRHRTSRDIRGHAQCCGLSTPNAEVACLIREKLSDEDIESLGLQWIVVMHEPIISIIHEPSLLRITRRDEGRWIYAGGGFPNDKWGRDAGFAFVKKEIN